MKLEVLAENMSDEGAATVLSEIETLVADYIANKSLRRMVKVKGGR